MSTRITTLSRSVEAFSVPAGVLQKCVETAQRRCNTRADELAPTAPVEPAVVGGIMDHHFHWPLGRRRARATVVLVATLTVGLAACAVSDGRAKLQERISTAATVFLDIDA
ncbi:hypothetical protein FHX48_000609 [Microbacterium halimionae]|uniref:Uncharacterized protein n=1 Tax=Microbacterium halimionae TaxID=1526413 RepID=A0A7W3JMH1_9MICO|nr:hypothetical protein [Microbacterium halimionae]MBA8815557.1 hypothetical protein [Microbacterium halimionae]NII95603.1 hypothetical protein [Microbacterium halimionae]